MGRRTIFAGTPTATRIDMRGPERPSWPDIDRPVNNSTGVPILGGGRLADIADSTLGQVGAVAAIALNYETDWDLVRVYFANGKDPQLLGPGQLLNVPREARVSRIEPVTPAPSTRLFNAYAALTGQYPTLSGVSPWKIVEPGAGDLTPYSYVNTGAVPAVWYKLVALGTSYYWQVQAAVAAGAIIPGGFLANAAAVNVRATDASPDGVWAFGDYQENNAIAWRNASAVAIPGLAFVASQLFDGLGNAGDPTNPTTKAYARYWAGGRVSVAKLSPLFFGRLALDIFDEDPGPDYIPRLAPQRQISFGQINVNAGAAQPDQNLVTVPMFNAKGAEFLFDNNGPGSLYINFYSQAPNDQIDAGLGVPDADPPPAAQFATIVSGNAGSIVLDQPRHPFVKILVGAGAGGAVIPAGAVLTIKREFTS